MLGMRMTEKKNIGIEYEMAYVYNVCIHYNVVGDVDEHSEIVY